MPNGTVHRVRRMIVGLLVLAILLLSAAQASTATSPDIHHGGAQVAGQAIAAAGYGVTARVSDDDCDHGLLCCIGGQCVMHAYWIPARADNPPSLTKLAVAYRRSCNPLPLGIATKPSSPPPRSGV